MIDFIGCCIGSVLGSIVGVTLAFILNDYWQTKSFRRRLKSPCKTYTKEWEREIVNPYSNNEEFGSKPKVIIRTEEMEYADEQNEPEQKD